MELISKKKLLETIEPMVGKFDDDGEFWWSRESILRAINNAPTVVERREGEWIKFYYVESIDDYWIGEDLGDDCTLYYAKWDNKLGFVFSASRYLPWGEHVVSPTSSWKEYTYPSEPKEIPFTEWIMGFVKKYFKGE